MKAAVSTISIKMEPVKDAIEAPVKVLTIDEQIVNAEDAIVTANDNYRKIAKDDASTEEDIDKAFDARKAAKVALTKLQAQKSADEAAAKLAEARNAELAKVQALLDAHDVNKTVQADKKATVEEKQAANEAFQAAKLAVENRMLPVHVSTPRAANKAVQADKPAGTRGAISGEIRTIATELFAQGKTGTEVRAFVIKERGFNDGTANAVIKALEDEMAGITK